MKASKADFDTVRWADVDDDDDDDPGHDFKK